MPTQALFRSHWHSREHTVQRMALPESQSLNSVCEMIICTVVESCKERSLGEAARSAGANSHVIDGKVEQAYESDSSRLSNVWLCRGSVYVLHDPQPC